MAKELTFSEYQHRPRVVHVIKYDGTEAQGNALIKEFPTLFEHVKNFKMGIILVCKHEEVRYPQRGDRIVFDFEGKRPVLVNIMPNRAFLKRYEPQDKRFNDAAAS